MILVTNYATVRISTRDRHVAATVLEAICAPRITTENHIVELVFIAFVGTCVLMSLELRDFVRRGRAVSANTGSSRPERPTIAEESLYKKAA